MEKLGLEDFYHPTYSPYLVPSIFHLFPKLEEFLGGKQIAANDEVKDTVTDQWNWSAANFC